MTDRYTVWIWVAIIVLSLYLWRDEMKFKRRLSAEKVIEAKVDAKRKRHAMREEWRGFGSDGEPR